MRLLSNFGMICRLQGSFLHTIAVHQLTSAKPSSGSWFLQIRDLCLKYGLPSPHSLLDSPPSKDIFKRLTKSKVIDFWESNLRDEATALRPSSLQNFKPEYMSLCKPHLIWTTCGSNPYEINKAVIQARMLSGRYVTDQLSRHWTDNKTGVCSLPTCTGQEIGSLEHLLLFCPALSETRIRVIGLCLSVASEHEELEKIIYTCLFSQNVNVQPVIKLKQASCLNLIKRLFYITRSWCYAIHRSRMNKLGLLEYR